MSRLHLLSVVALLILLSLVVLPAAAQTGVCEGDTVEVWTETENEWLGIWTEQSDGSFIAEWSRPGDVEYTSELTITIDDENQIAIDRINPRNPDFYLQGDCTYEGELAEGGGYASGTAICEVENGVMTDTYPWQATISCGAPEIDTNASAVRLPGEAGALFSFVCAPISDNNPVRRLWGSDFYTSDSSICTAAVHAGVITTEGGTVTIQIYRGLDSYFGSERNGITSSAYGAYDRSFTFYGLNAINPVTNGIGWGTNAVSLRDQIGATFDFTCPDNGSPGAVWGTEVYTDDSSICTAAVHAGLITFENGGAVSIQMLAGQETYTSTTQNGVTSTGYDKWYGSYRFVK